MLFRGKRAIVKPTTSQASSLTDLLDAWRAGDGAAYAQIFEQAYTQLKQIAAQRLQGAAEVVTLSPTEMMHEAVLRVMDAQVQWQNRAHFFASMSLYMRSVLVDHVRSRQSDRRGGGALHVTLGQEEAGAESEIADLLVLDSALNRLAALDARSSAVLHLTYFAGLDRHQIADVLKVSVQIVDRELRFAKSWLNVHLTSPL
jgi:RNA polymerase sigma factor (TIGR02999 family)